jgi:hypothetical protein
MINVRSWAPVLTDLATGGGDTRGGFSRIRYSKSRDQRLIDSRLLNVVLVLMLTTSILGPILKERFAPLLLKAQPGSDAATATA